jgi:hypothetical protein
MSGINNTSLAGTQPVSGTVAISSVAGTVAISGSTTVSGTIAATQSGTWNIGIVYPALTQAAINFSASGNTVLVAASGSKIVNVYRILVVNSDPALATNLIVGDTTPTNFSGAIRLTSGGQLSGDGQGSALYTGGAGQGFQLNSSVAVQMSGTIWFTQV